MLYLIIGILLIVFAVVSTIVCIAKTPTNLRGFYGVMFAIIAIGSLIGGICMLLTYFGTL